MLIGSPIQGNSFFSFEANKKKKKGKEGKTVFQAGKDSILEGGV